MKKRHNEEQYVKEIKFITDLKYIFISVLFIKI
jgi:hypothetical protein